MERRAGREDGEPCQQRPLVLVEEVVAPVDGLPQRLLSRREIARPAREESEALVEPLAQHTRRECSDPRSGELDRERQSVDAATDLDEVVLVRLRPRERRLEELRALDEELDRLGLAEGRDREDVLARDVEHRPARDEDRQARRPRDQLGVERGCPSQVLRVVHHEQQILRRHRPNEGLGRFLTRHRGVTEAREDRLGDERRIAEGRELDEHRTVGEGRRRPASRLEREARLAAPAGPCQHHEAHVVALEQLDELRYLSLATYERRRGHRERGSRSGARRLHLELRIVSEDPLLERAQAPTWLQAELVELCARQRIVRERVRLAAAAVQREDCELLRPLAKGARLCKGDELDHDVAVTAEGELRPEPLLGRGEAELLEPLRLAPQRDVVGEVAEGAAAPEPERPDGEHPRTCGVLLATCLDRLREEGLEPQGVDVNRLGGERVAAGARHDPERGWQRLPQLGHVQLQQLARRSRWHLAPERVGKLVQGADSAVFDVERCEQPPLHRGQGDRPAVGDDLDRPEHA